MTITHYDLFAGIGGFSLALDEVFNDRPIRHIFCEWEQFPTAVLKQHWPDGEYWGDIAELVADTKSKGLERRSRSEQAESSDAGRIEQDFTIVTGGFPCQPFSAAGRRRGTADDRYKWPEMFQVIRNVKPEWVVAENVRGLTTWNDGMVLETVCSDLESEGYEVQPFIIPAVAVNAPHRRDRVWVIACHTEHNGFDGTKNGQGNLQRNDHNAARSNQTKQFARPSISGGLNAHPRPQRRKQGGSKDVQSESQESKRQNYQYPDWKRDWQKVAFATCDDSMDDGLPRLVDGVPQSFAKWRQNSLKAYGNGIVHQIAVEIFKAIKTAEQELIKVGE